MVIKGRVRTADFGSVMEQEEVVDNGVVDHHRQREQATHALEADIIAALRQKLGD